MNKNQIVGKRISKLRETNHLTRQDLAQRSGLSESEICLLEEDANNTSLAPLMRISRAFGVRLGTFLDDQASSGVTITRAAQSNKESADRITYNSLSDNRMDRYMEPFLLDIKPGSAEKKPLSHEGEKCLYIIEGSVTLQHGNESHLLHTGDSIYFDAIVPHNITTSEPNGARAMLVTYAPL